MIIYSKDTVFCGYSMPHPSEAVVNIRLQTQNNPVIEVFRDGLTQLVDVAEHIEKTFEAALETGPVDSATIPSSSSVINNNNNTSSTSSKSKKSAKQSNVNESMDIEEDEQKTDKKSKKKTKA